MCYVSIIFFSCCFNSGSIISKNYVITAAHCTINRKPRYVRVIAGALNRQNDGISYKLEKIVNHPKFDPEHIQNDIALIKIKKEFEFSNNVKAIALPQSMPNAGSNVLVSGWGQIMVEFHSFSVLCIVIQ